VTKLKKIGDRFIATTKSKNRFEARAVIIASGANPRPLEVPGEKEFLGRGLSYCATCDGPLFDGKTVAVIGGGNSAFETAIFLSKIAKKIYILEYSDKVKADPQNQELAKRTDKIEIITKARVKEIKGEKFVNSLLHQDRKTGKKVNLLVEGIFVEIGSIPATSFIKGLVDFNERDEIKVDFETMETKTPGLFAAGDCNVGQYKQIVTACGEGAKAVLAAYDYLQN
jgi:thioredoxin reductase